MLQIEGQSNVAFPEVPAPICSNIYSAGLDFPGHGGAPYCSKYASICRESWPRSPKYTVLPPLARRSSRSNWPRSVEDGWWMVQRMACPASASSRKSFTIDQADWESNPEVGSSRNIKREGRATSSIPIVVRFRCSAPSPFPGLPITASPYSSMPNKEMILST